MKKEIKHPIATYSKLYLNDIKKITTSILKNSNYPEFMSNFDVEIYSRHYMTMHLTQIVASIINVIHSFVISYLASKLLYHKSFVDRLETLKRLHHIVISDVPRFITHMSILRHLVNRSYRDIPEEDVPTVASYFIHLSLGQKPVANYLYTGYILLNRDPYIKFSFHVSDLYQDYRPVPVSLKIYRMNEHTPSIYLVPSFAFPPGSNVIPMISEYYLVYNYIRPAPPSYFCALHYFNHFDLISLASSALVLPIQVWPSHYHSDRKRNLALSFLDEIVINTQNIVVSAMDNKNLNNVTQIVSTFRNFISELLKGFDVGLFGDIVIDGVNDSTKEYLPNALFILLLYVCSRMYSVIFDLKSSFNVNKLELKIKSRFDIEKALRLRPFSFRLNSVEISDLYGLLSDFDGIMIKLSESYLDIAKRFYDLYNKNRHIYIYYGPSVKKAINDIGWLIDKAR